VASLQAGELFGEIAFIVGIVQIAFKTSAAETAVDFVDHCEHRVFDQVRAASGFRRCRLFDALAKSASMTWKRCFSVRWASSYSGQFGNTLDVSVQFPSAKTGFNAGIAVANKFRCE